MVWWICSRVSCWCSYSPTRRSFDGCTSHPSSAARWRAASGRGGEWRKCFRAGLACTPCIAAGAIPAWRVRGTWRPTCSTEHGKRCRCKNGEDVGTFRSGCARPRGMGIHRAARAAPPVPLPRQPRVEQERQKGSSHDRRSNPIHDSLPRAPLHQCASRSDRCARRVNLADARANFSS